MFSRPAFLRPAFLLMACLLFCAHCLAVQVQVTVTDTQGHPLKDALVIVQELGPPQRDVFRELTNDAGEIAPQSLPPGVYRAISTYPYSQRQTSLQEFLLRDQPVKVDLRMAAASSLDDLPVSIGRLTVHVLATNGQPAVGARVLVRDAEAHLHSEHWGTTDAQGTTTLELSDQPSTLVIVYRDKLYTFPTSGLETERTVRLK